MEHTSNLRSRVEILLLHYRVGPQSGEQSIFSHVFPRLQSTTDRLGPVLSPQSYRETPSLYKPPPNFLALCFLLAFVHTAGFISALRTGRSFSAL